MSSQPLFFIDTNVLIYARDERFPDKQRAAQGWMATLARQDRAIVSPQVIGEFINAILKNRAVPRDEITSSLQAIWPFMRGATTDDIMAHAWALRAKTGFQWWDCVILANAAALKCDCLLSEDYQNGRTIDGVTIVDPFSAHPDDILKTLKAS
jgi:predicted nucleic acid-binding protein